ncbi:MAG: N-acetylmuramoyl-L-alanine amidase [Bacteroidales bacterium]|nr:N-acetylmuramoyl-L-alanine amidase [Bacteroidales bacterium]
MNNYITAILLIIYLPKVAYLWVRENWKALTIAIGSTLALLVIFYNFGNREMTSNRYTDNDVAVNFQDLTAAFATGGKRTMQVEMIAIHHTAGNAKIKVYDLAKYQFQKFGNVAYHFLVMPDGTIYQLRPLEERVPHAYGCNDNAIAVCLAGNFNDYPVPEVQRKTALRLCRWLLKKYKLEASNVLAHGELTIYSPNNVTDCCGKMFDIKKFRQEL